MGDITNIDRKLLVMKTWKYSANRQDRHLYIMFKKNSGWKK